MTPPFVAQESRAKLALGLLGCLAFVATSAFLWTLPDPEANTIAVAAGGLFGFFGIAIAARLFKPRRDTLVLDDTGFFDRRVSPDHIAWSDIISAQTIQIQRSRFISLELDRPERFTRSRLARLNKSTGFNDLNIGLGFLDHKPAEIETEFYARLNAYLTATGGP